MAEDKDINEPSGPAPGDEVPYEERFLSSEKQYPTKEARKKALDEAKLPHVPPFITEPTPKPDWHPVEELTEQVPMVNTKPMENPSEKPPQAQAPVHLEAKGGLEPMRRILKAQEQIEQKATETTAKTLRSVGQTPRKVETPTKTAPTAKQEIRQQILQTPEPVQKESLFRKLINRFTASKPQEQPVSQPAAVQAQEVPKPTEPEMTDAQAKWKRMAEQRRGPLPR